MAVHGKDSKIELRLRGRGARFCNCSFRSQTKSAGVALIYTILVVFVTLNIAFFISSIFAVKLRSSFEYSNSVIAYYAAESGIEWQLYNSFKDPDASQPSLTNGATFTITSPPLKSVGKFSGISRAIELNIQ